MAIRARSLQHNYSEFWSGDSAFEQPPDEPKTTPDKDPKAWETWTKSLTDWQRRVKIARETGDWAAMRIDGGEEPTQFVLRPVPGHVFRKLVDDVTRGELGGTEAMTLMLQLALVDVIGLEGSKLEMKRVKHPRYGDMASVDMPNLLDQIDPRIVGELGGTVRDRAQGVLPLL